MKHMASWLTPKVNYKRDSEMRTLFWRVLVLGGCVAMLASAPARADEFLDVDAAFRLSARPADDGTILRFDIAPGYHLYRERITVSAVPDSLRLAALQMPAGTVAYDANFGHDVETYAGTLELHQVFLGRAAFAASSAVLQIGYQGCADAGLCYPPQTRELRLTFSGGLPVAIAPVVEAPAAVTTPAAAVAPTASSLVPAPATASGASGKISAALKSGRLPTIAGLFLIAGLLLSFTPCVLPMVPILASIIVGQSGTVSRARGFSLALSYSLGMALVYTVFGLVAGLLGEGLAASLQNPWVLGVFALLMAALALSMFGAYQLQLPASLQTRLTAASGRMRGGSYAGVFLMGGLSALIVGPCVAAPLAGALVYISQTRDVVIGGVALFSLATGMSVPLLLVGLSAGTLLPRAGAWMESVKTTMGLLLLGVAWWMVSPVLPAAASLLLLAALLALAAALLGAFHQLDTQAGLRLKAAKAMGWLLAWVAAAQMAGALSGADSPLQPLQPLVARGATATLAAAEPQTLSFQRIDSNAALDAALRGASGQAVMLDFYADWCVSCKELEHGTFSDPRVRQRADKAIRLRADVTANTEAQQALLKRFGLFGPPGVLFFGGEGTERSGARVIGYQNAEAFLDSLNAAGL
jgi:thiol:disulfide interchange protein DsbD